MVMQSPRLRFAFSLKKRSGLPFYCTNNVGPDRYMLRRQRAISYQREPCTNWKAGGGSSWAPLQFCPYFYHYAILLVFSLFSAEQHAALLTCTCLEQSFFFLWSVLSVMRLRNRWWHLTLWKQKQRMDASARISLQCMHDVRFWTSCFLFSCLNRSMPPLIRESVEKNKDLIHRVIRNKRY